MPQSTTSRSHARSLAIMAAILAVCAVAFIAASEASKAFDASDTPSDQAFLALDADDADEISWTYGGNGYRLVLEDGTWKDAEAPDIAVDQTSAEEIASALADAEVSRAISAGEISDEMGLDDPAATATVTTSDGSQQTFSIGAQTTDGQGYYASIDGEEGARVVDTSLECLLTTMMDLYQQDASPSATTIDSLVVERAGRSTLTLIHDSEGVEGSYTDEYTWSVDDGETAIATSNSKASGVTSVVNYVSWSSLVAVDGQQDGAYGFDNPTLTATLSYTTTSEEETGEVDEDGKAVTETVETPHTFVLVIGAQADEGGYYAMVEGSSKVYTIAQDDVDTLLSANIDSLRDDSVCLMDWDTVDSIDISFDGNVKTLAITRTEETDDEGETETTTSYTLDGAELASSDAEELLDAIDALESEGEGDSASAADASPELSLTFHRNTETHSEMTLSLTRYDNNFYLVSFNEEERLLVNRNAVTDLSNMVSGW